MNSADRKPLAESNQSTLQLHIAEAEIDVADLGTVPVCFIVAFSEPLTPASLRCRGP